MFPYRLSHGFIIGILVLSKEVKRNVVFFEHCYGFIAEETQWFIFENCKKVFIDSFFFENSALGINFHFELDIFGVKIFYDYIQYFELS